MLNTFNQFCMCYVFSLRKRFKTYLNNSCQIFSLLNCVIFSPRKYNACERSQGEYTEHKKLSLDHSSAQQQDRTNFLPDVISNKTNLGPILSSV